MTDWTNSEQPTNPFDSLLDSEDFQTGDTLITKKDLYRQVQERSGLAPSVKYKNRADEVLSTDESIFPGLLFVNQEPGKGSKYYDFHFKPKELTIIAAENGAGKSMLTGQLALQLLKQNQKVCILSFEMPPEHTLIRMFRQMLCNESHQKIDLQTDKNRIEEIYQNFAYDLIICDHVGHVNESFVFTAMRDAIDAYQCNIFFIDPLTNCIDSEEEYSEVRRFVQDLKEFADKNLIHICLVHHMRKQINGANYDIFNEIDKSNIRGTSGIADAADNIFTMARNKAKIKARYQGIDVDDTKPDLILALVKNRLGSWTGFINLWFNRYALCFCETNERNTIDVWR